MPLAQYTGLCEGAHYKEQNVCFTPSSRKFKTWGTLCWKPGQGGNCIFFSPHYTSHTRVFYNLKIFKSFKFSIQGFRHRYSIFNQMISWFSSPAVLHSACCLLVLSCDHATQFFFFLYCVPCIFLLIPHLYSPFLPSLGLPPRCLGFTHTHIHISPRTHTHKHYRLRPAYERGHTVSVFLSFWVWVSSLNILL